MGNIKEKFEIAEMDSCACNVNSDYPGMLASWGKSELLKEKVKRKLEQKYGKELDMLADLIVEIIEEKDKERFRELMN